MELIELLPTLHLLRFDVGNVYLWHEGDALTLIDTGVPGSGAEIKAAVEGLGFTLGQLRAVVVTHGHDDHWGSLSELGDDAPFLVHAADAPVLRGDYRQRVPDPADLPGWERDLLLGLPPMPAPSPVRVDRELADGDVLDFGGGAHVIGIPGHTPGSIAVHVPAHRLLFAGDTMLGVFNLDRQGAADSFRRLSELDLSLVCVGHGDPVTGDASARLRAVQV